MNIPNKALIHLATVLLLTSLSVAQGVVLKPGGLILFSMSQAGYEQYGFGAQIDALQETGAWTLVDETAPFQTFPYSEDHADVRHWVSVFRKTV